MYREYASKTSCAEINSGKLYFENSDNFFLNAGLIVHSKKGFYTHHALDYFREMIPHRNYQITAETYYFKAGYSFSAIGNHKKI